MLRNEHLESSSFPMKSLGRTIDQILKIEPMLEEALVPIKNRWKRYPSKTMTYWKELLDCLNSKDLLNHPKRTEIKNILTIKRKTSKKIFSFDATTTNDRVLGIIPENVSDRIKSIDRQTIDLAKKRIEASMTHDEETMAYVSRKDVMLEIGYKKIWVDLKDHFHLWDKNTNVTIKRHGDVLVLVELPSPSQLQLLGPGVMRMDPDMLKQFFKFLGMDPPEMGIE